MKRYMAAWLRKTANRLDPPSHINWSVTGAPYFTNATATSSSNWPIQRR